MFEEGSKKGAVIEAVEGGFIVTVVGGGGALSGLFGPAEEAKKIFPKFRDAFDFLAFHIAPGENDADTLKRLEDDFNLPDPNDSDPDSFLGKG